MTAEIRIPISPTPSFVHQVLLIASSLRRFYPDAVVRAYVGAAEGPTPDANRLLEDAFNGKKIGFEWIGQDQFNAWRGTRSPYLATMNRRFQPSTSEHIIIADADILIVNRFDELFRTNAVQGVMAHVAPLTQPDMRLLCTLADAPWPDKLLPYSGNGIMYPMGSETLFYPNSGFVFAPRALFERLIEPYHESISLLRRHLSDTYWFDQLALALAIAKSGVPHKALPLRYNFPNQAAFDAAHLNELNDIRVLHYLREDTIHRTRDFADLNALRRLMNRTDLGGSNEVLRRTIAANMVFLEPTPLAKAEDAPWA